jgi:cytoskeletal protein CcmA (bactofilin family)
MIRKFIVTILALGAALGVALSAAPGSVAAHESPTTRVLGSIEVGPGEHAGDVSTVNGGVHIGTDAVVGHAHAVNGGVHIDSRATAAELTTVNGGIKIADGAHITGDIHTVNGTLHIDRGAEVLGAAGNVNGSIHIAGAHVGGSVTTTNGDIDLGPDARIDGNVVVKEDNSWHYGRDRYPHVVIGPGTVVKGELRFERKVVLYVSDHATIGTVQGAEVLKFSGDHPPIDRE